MTGEARNDAYTGTEWITRTEHKSIHVMPDNEGHLMHEECPCEPRVDFLSNHFCLMTHHSIGDSAIDEARGIIRLC